MARIRSIKPEFFTSEDVSALPLSARLTWIGLWTQCDDHGRTKDNVRLIKAALWPLDDVNLADVEKDLAVLAECGRIVRYETEVGRFLAVVNWHGHQAINRPSAARHPGPPVALSTRCPVCAVPNHDPDSDPSVSPHGGFTPGGEGKGREQGGDARPREAPPRTCLAHHGIRNPPPCGGCADARRAHDEWKQAQRDRVTAVPAPTCPEHPGEPAGRCGRCSSGAVPMPAELRRKRA